MFNNVDKTATHVVDAMFNNFEKVSSHICMQKDVGINGNLFGGVMLAWLADNNL